MCAVTLIGIAACEEGSGVNVKNLEFEGLQSVTKSQLMAVLATGESSKLPWGEKRYFNREQFEADIKRIVAFYRDRGFPDARVASFDVKLSPDQSSVAIVVRISEGEPLRVERIELKGFEVLPERARRFMEAQLPLKPGQPADRALLQASREAALDRLKDNGYPYATVRLAEANGGSNERSRIVELIAEPGILAQYGPIEITGNSSVNDEVVRRQLTFRPGEIYRQSRLLESQRRLYALEVFEFANVQPVREEGEQPQQIPTRITVTEGKHRKLNLGFGYGTEEKARVQADWRHVNFFGGARTAGVLARYSSLDRGVKVNFTEPYLFSPLYTFSLAGQYWHNDEPAFKLDNVGGRITIARQFARGGAVGFRRRATNTLSFTYANEWEHSIVSNETLQDLSLRDELIALGIDPRRGETRGQKSAISLDAGRNTTGNILDARRGYLAALHLEQAGRWLGGDFNYYEVTAEGRYYRTVFNRAVIAVRGRIGSIDPLSVDISGDEEDTLEIGVPFHKRYFLGGAANLRGWGRFDVSPLSAFGLPIGGHSFMDFSTELRVPIWGKLGGVIFLDGGNVWRRPWDISTTDLYYDVGPGLRYNTPIGPLRADFGYQLNRIPGLRVNGELEKRRYRFHFSIGQAF